LRIGGAERGERKVFRSCLINLGRIEGGFREPWVVEVGGEEGKRRLIILKSSSFDWRVEEKEIVGESWMTGASGKSGLGGEEQVEMRK